MAYFNNIPNIEYDTKPIQYPFSESDYVVAKNFFRRYQVNPDVFSYAVYFKKYSVVEGQKIYEVADLAYGDPFLDWVIVLTNNLVDPQFDWPMSEYDLRKYCEQNYENPYSEILYYKTYEVKDDSGRVVLPANLRVDKSFYDAPKYEIDTTSSFLPESNIAIQATATTTMNYYIERIQFTSGIGYEYVPDVYVEGNAEATAELTDYGTIKRIEITNGGSGYEYPPIVTFTGSLKDLTGTSTIDENGSVTEIIIDSYDPEAVYGIDADVILSTNPQQETQASVTATATIVFGKFLKNIEVINRGSGYLGTRPYNSYTMGGNPTTPSTLTPILNYEMSINLTNQGNAYESATIELNGDGEGATAGITVGSNKVLKVFIINRGTGYTTAPSVSISAPDAENVVNEGDVFKYNGSTWLFKNSYWRKLVKRGFVYNNDGEIIEVAGNQISYPVTAFEHEQELNEKKREIYLLKPSFLQSFLDDFRKTNLYSKSSDYISSTLKKTGV